MLLDLLREGKVDEPLRALAAASPEERLRELAALAGGRVARRGRSGLLWADPGAAAG